jgi:hypothetical protein
MGIKKTYRNIVSAIGLLSLVVVLFVIKIDMNHSKTHIFQANTFEQGLHYGKLDIIMSSLKVSLLSKFNIAELKI